MWGSFIPNSMPVYPGAFGPTPSSNYSALHRAVGLWYFYSGEFRKVMPNGSRGAGTGMNAI
jgi:hypothetical protein